MFRIYIHDNSHIDSKYSYILIMGVPLIILRVVCDTILIKRMIQIDPQHYVTFLYMFSFNKVALNVPVVCVGF